MTLDLDTGRVIRQDLDADFGLTMWDPDDADGYDDGVVNLIDEGTPITGIHDIEWKGERYEVTVEIKRVSPSITHGR